MNRKKRHNIRYFIYHKIFGNVRVMIPVIIIITFIAVYHIAKYLGIAIVNYN